jgi:hypothetical protein
MSKRLEGLEQKVHRTVEVSNKASRISQIVQEHQIKNIHDQINDTEFNKIQKLFSGASPCLEELIVPDDSNSDDDLLGNLDTVMELEDPVAEANTKAYEVACAAACDAAKIAMEAIAAVAAIPNRNNLSDTTYDPPESELNTSNEEALPVNCTASDLKEIEVEVGGSEDSASHKKDVTPGVENVNSGSLVSSMANKLLSDLYQPSTEASS